MRSQNDPDHGAAHTQVPHLLQEHPGHLTPLHSRSYVQTRWSASHFAELVSNALLDKAPSVIGTPAPPPLPPSSSPPLSSSSPADCGFTSTETLPRLEQRPLKHERPWPQSPSLLHVLLPMLPRSFANLSSSSRSLSFSLTSSVATASAPATHRASARSGARTPRHICAAPKKTMYGTEASDKTRGHQRPSGPPTRALLRECERTPAWRCDHELIR